MEILKLIVLIINIFVIKVTAELITVDEKWVSPQKAYYCYSLREHNSKYLKKKTFKDTC